jgi:two-component system, NtrC family, response regulator AtoC
MSLLEKKVLIVEDEANMRRILSAMLTREGFAVRTADDGQQAMQLLEGGEPIQLVLSDLRMPHVDGLELLRRIKRAGLRTELILITAHGSIETAVEAMKHGAFDYITKPFDANELRIKVGNAFRTYQHGETEASIKPEGLGRYNFVGASAASREIWRVLDKVADSPTTILITGESGTGKELVATAIHESSSRRDKPFIKINCAAIPETLLESELFGHEKGAFTGAVTSKPGRFELADGGTLFLDEIGEMPRELQVKLLRCLQERELERVGGLRVIRVDVRLIAATNKDLEAEVASGGFRQDLFYRLNVVPIRIPPLRERIEDVDVLVPYFVARFNKRLGRQISEVTPPAMAVLRAYRWPGNIRELENVIERSILLAEGDVLDVAELPPHVRESGEAGTQALREAGTAALQAPEAGAAASLKDVVREHTRQIEKRVIQQTLSETGGNVTKAAELLQISRKSLQMKMKEYGLRTPRPEAGLEPSGRE